MKITINIQQYRELTVLLVTLNITEGILLYWNNELEAINKQGIKLSKPTIKMLRQFIEALTDSLSKQKERYSAIIEQIAKDCNYNFDDNTLIKLSNDELAIEPIQETEIKENDNNGME